MDDARARRDRAIAATLFVIVSSIYFATLSGITSSNDGSHYALVRAMVDRGSFEISPFLAFTEHQDFAERGELRFSDRPPGTALIAAPLYALGYLAPTPPAPLPSKHDAENPRLLYAVLAAPLSAAGAVAICYLTLRQRLQRSESSALLIAIALALGTISWKYGSVLYSHAVGMLVVWAAFAITLRLEQRPLSGQRWWLALGAVLGFAPLVEYTNLVFMGLLGGYSLSILARLRRGPAGRHAVGSLAALAAGAAVPMGALLAYNTLNFGGPFELSTFNVDTTRWPQNAGLAADFATPLRVGLPAMLIYGQNNQGLFLLTPFSLLSFAGLVPMWRANRRHTLLTVGLFMAMLLLFAKSTTFNPLTNDGRYLAPFIGLWLIPTAYWLDDVYQPLHRGIARLLLDLAIFGLLWLSIRNQILHIAFSWNYGLDYASLSPMATTPGNIALILRTVFRNTANLPLLWAAQISALGGSLLIARCQRNWQQQS